MARSVHHVRPNADRVLRQSLLYLVCCVWHYTLERCRPKRALAPFLAPLVSSLGSPTTKWKGWGQARPQEEM